TASAPAPPPAPAPTPASSSAPEEGAGRVSRERLLGIAAGLLATGAAFVVIGAILELITVLESEIGAGWKVAKGLEFGSALVLPGALAAACLAFLGPRRERDRRIGLAAIGVAAAFALQAIAGIVRAPVVAAHAVAETAIDVGSLVASESVGAVAAIAAVV